MLRSASALALVACALALASIVTVPRTAVANPGFYSAGPASPPLVNEASHVVLFRDGTRTVVSMRNDYKGPVARFALVVPVPGTLVKEDVKVLPRDLFDRLESLGAPRLTESWEQDPCPGADSPLLAAAPGESFGDGGLGLAPSPGERSGGGGGGARIEARFEVGEYDVAIVAASDTAALETWLREQKLALPAGAEPHLRPYLERGMKLLVARVDPGRVPFVGGRATLSPLRFHYDESTLTLPLQLGLVSPSGTADVVVDVIARQTRYEIANRPSVAIPTNLEVSPASRARFGELYAALLDRVLREHPRAAVTEYAWDPGTCDGCPALSTLDGDDLATLGADVVPGGLLGLVSRRAPSPPEGSGAAAPVAHAGRIRERTLTADGLAGEMARRAIRQKSASLRACYDAGLARSSKLTGSLSFTLEIGADGFVERATESGDLGDAETRACMVRAMTSIHFPAPGASKARIVYGVDLAPEPDGPPAGASAPAAPPRPLGATASSSSTPYVLSRMHLRYGKEALGEDPVFRAAPPIAGGREVRSREGVLESGASLATENRFQARYVIRHAFRGAVRCEQPRRGVWGGPPPGSDAGKALPPETARSTAFARRGVLDLSTYVSGTDALGGVTLPPSGVEAVASAAPGPSAAPGAADASPPATEAKAEAKKSGCGACTLSASRAGSSASAAALTISVGLGLLLLARGRARRNARRRIEDTLDRRSRAHGT